MELGSRRSSLAELGLNRAGDSASQMKQVALGRKNKDAFLQQALASCEQVRFAAPHRATMGHVAVRKTTPANAPFPARPTQSRNATDPGDIPGGTARQLAIPVEQRLSTRFCLLSGEGRRQEFRNCLTEQPKLVEAIGLFFPQRAGGAQGGPGGGAPPVNFKDPFQTPVEF